MSFMASGGLPPQSRNDASNVPYAPHARRRYWAGAGLMTTVEANGVTLGVEHFGDAAAPLVLLAGGTTMLSWPDALDSPLLAAVCSSCALRPPSAEPGLSGSRKPTTDDRGGRDATHQMSHVYLAGRLRRRTRPVPGESAREARSGAP